MDIDFATLFPSLHHECDGIVEDTLDVFTDMILQVVAFIYHSLIFVVVFTVISRTVNNMSDSNVLECLTIFCNQITSQV